MVVSLDASFSDVYFHIQSSGGVIESAKVKARLPIRMLQCEKFETEHDPNELIHSKPRAL